MKGEKRLGQAPASRKSFLNEVCNVWKQRIYLSELNLYYTISIWMALEPYNVDNYITYLSKQTKNVHKLSIDVYINVL